MTHPDLAITLRQLVDEERFDEAEQLLPVYTRAVTEECISASREHQFREACEFVRATLQTLKARRAHYIREITEADRRRAYLGHSVLTKSIDVAG